MRRIWESVIASVTGGLILWSVTSSMSQPAHTTERTAMVAAPVIGPTPAPIASYTADEPRPTTAGDVDINHGPSLTTSATAQAPAPRMDASRPIPASIPGPTTALSPPKPNLLHYSIPVGAILLYEKLLAFPRRRRCNRLGTESCIRAGLDHRNWLVSNLDGTHPVGCRIRLPNEFYFECRYSANIPEVTRGILGWWKAPLSTKVVFLNDQGVRYAIEWVIGCGNDVTRLNPLGSSSLYAKKSYHIIKLPDGNHSEVGSLQPTGMLRIDRENNAVKVFIDGQAAAVGTIGPMGQLGGFEIDVVKARNGTLSFTDFKIAR